MLLTERFDLGALSYIIRNFGEFEFRPETDATETLAMIQRYRASARSDGTQRVTYRRAEPGHGRYFAEHGRSLQSMAREIRNAISHPFYEDLDFENCHPTLLLKRCEREGVACRCLERYVSRRDEVLGELGERGKGKQAVLAVINGGTADAGRRGVRPTEWLTAFEDEMKGMREALVGRADWPYHELARRSLARRGRGADNLLGSALNMMLCDAENDALMALRCFLEAETERRVGVLVFDGCMLERESSSAPGCTPELLRKAGEYVEARTGFRLVVSVKDMKASMLAVPAFVYASGGGSSGALQPQRLPRYAEDDAGGGTLFLEDIAGGNIPEVRCCRGRVYVLDGTLWTDDTARVSKLLLARCMGCNIRRLTPGGEDSGTLSGNVPSARRIIEAALALMPDDPTFVERMWHSNTGVVCYRNGVYDFRARTFSAYSERTDVLPFVRVERDFPTQRPAESVLADVRERLLTSTLGSDEMVRTYLHIVARAMAGMYTDKQWVIMMGERNSGKGLLQTVNEQAYGDYVNTVNANAFLLQQFASGDAAKGLSWALDCEFTRQTYTNEVKCDPGSRSIKLDGNVIKSFQSGGDAMSARKNHKDERTFRVGSKLIMNMNDIPEMSPRDAAATLLLIKFPFKFVSAEELEGEANAPFYRLLDGTIKNDYIKRQQVIDAFTWLVADAFEDHAVVPCRQVREDTLGFRMDVGDDLIVMLKKFKVTRRREDYLLISELRTFAKSNNLSPTVVKERLRKMGAWEDANCFVGGVRHGRGMVGVVMTVADGLTDDLD